MNRKIVLGLLNRVHIGTAGDLLSTLARDRASRAKMRLGVLNALHGGWVDVPRGGVDERLATIPDPAWVDELEPMVPLIVESLKGAQDALRELEREVIGCGDADLVEGVDWAVSDLRATLSGVRMPGAPLTDDPDRMRRVSQWALGEHRRLLARWKAGLPDAGGNAADAGSVGGKEPKPKRDRAEWIAKAMMLVRDHPDWSNRKIAGEVGVDPGTLSRCQEYKAAAQMARDEGRTPKRGRITMDAGGRWDVDGTDDDDE